jgi:uncharacterized protein
MDVSLFLVAAICLGAALAQGFSGFGFGIILMATLSLCGADLERASVLSTLLSTALVITLLFQTSRRMRVDWKQAASLGIGLLVGVPIGYRLLLRFGEMPVGRIVFGLVLIAFALNRMFTPHLKRHISLFFAPAFGLFSGLLGGAFSSGGPPVVMYLYTQEDDPRQAVGTTQAVFLASNLYRLTWVFCGERGISAALGLRAMLLTPVVIAAGLFGFQLARRFSLRPFLIAVYGVIILSGCINVYKGICGWPH